MSAIPISPEKPPSRLRRPAALADYRTLVTLLNAQSDAEFADVEWRGLDALYRQIRPLPTLSPVEKESG